MEVTVYQAVEYDNADSNVFFESTQLEAIEAFVSNWNMIRPYQRLAVIHD